MGGGRANKKRTALQRAVDSGAENEAVSRALEEFVKDRDRRKTELEQAQERLREILTVRQEAVAALAGLL